MSKKTASTQLIEFAHTILETKENKSIILLISINHFDNDLQDFSEPILYADDTTLLIN